MFSVSFLRRTAEEGAAAFLVAFGGVALAGDGALSRAALAGAVAAGLRAVYGVFVKNVGADAERPSMS
ncbi:hypothetical protein OV450_3437 [Actinobacteria bacterium OV450]|nr:hypothetical protein OV450_3437 [Actinobacteria bacterium OV450]